ALARTFGPPLSGAVRAAQHRIIRWHRLDRDQRKLAYFVPRGPALAAFDRLRTGSEREWALHYVGVGGTGKTSLIRHLGTRVAAEQGLQVARIDFDHLSPTYPARDPGQLFATLLYELTSLIETERQDKLLGFLDRALEALSHEPLPATSNVRALLDTRAVAELTSWFGSLLQTFPRPTLILDTCEELTKLELVDGLIPSVEATFLLLERFHELAPDLRVVFAGRRLLAGEYANWRAPDDAARRGGVGTRRDYVRLHELRGFDRSEAITYLDKRLPASRHADPELTEKLLALSPEPLRVQALAAGDAGPAESHYNPFDLSRYADWVEAEPEVQADALDAAGADPYVEVRIIQRMGQLDALLPAVALLRRFDAAMLGDALPPGVDPRPVFDELARHEWLRVKGVPDRTVIEVDRGLPDRIERALAASRGLEVERVRAQLGGRLRDRITSAKLPKIPVEVFDGALRLLPAEEAVALWRSIEQRIDAEADWTWAAELGHDLIADGYAAESADSAVRIYILATMASALIHTGAIAEAARLWREIEEGASPSAWLLQQRARWGLVAARASDAAPGELGELARTAANLAGELEQAGRTHELESSRCAALEAIAEAAERTPETIVPELRALGLLACFRDPALDAFGVILAARFALLGGAGGRSPEVIRTLALAARDPGQPASQIDWWPPESLRDRLRLEVVRMHRFLDEEPAGLGDTVRSVLEARAPAWLAEASTSTTDGDRLAAALALDHGAAPSPSLVRRTTTTEPREETIVWTGDERCAAHRQYPPLGFAIARKALLRGELEAARAAITVLPQPWAARLACETARWSRSEKDLDAIGTMPALDPHTAREIASGWAIVAGATAHGSPLAVEGYYYLARRSAEPRGWSCMPARTRAELDGLLGTIRPLLDGLYRGIDDEAPISRARSSLMIQEVIALSRYTEAPVPPRPLVKLPAIHAIHPDLREEAIRLKLRAYALDRSRTYDGPTNQATIAAAIEEAELLDLRLPDLALGLFAWAEQAAKHAGLARLRGRALFGALLAAHHARDKAGLVQYGQIWRTEQHADPYEPLVQQLLEVDREAPGGAGRDPNIVLRPYERGVPGGASHTKGGADERPPTIRIQAAVEKRAGVILEADLDLPGAIRAEIDVPRPGIPPRFGDQGLVAAIHELVRRGDHVALQILPDPSLSSRCWEAAVYSLDPQSSLLSRLDCYRVLPGAPPARSAAPPRLLIVASETIKQILSLAWQWRPGVVHIVRRFGRSLRGQIEITQDYQRDRSDRPAMMKELQLEGAELLVLQCDPVDDGLMIAADSAEPELAREFATTAIRRTGACALILPPMPVDLVEPVARLLAREAGELSPRRLVSAARAVRLHLADRGHARLAQEVTLFLREDLSS
ncbi:MAG TPA: ATP-binding protein, partial [Kofleriaceae bacterium]|nr:ATP-binding protein [Kofleriaceae bacterium]